MAKSLRFKYIFKEDYNPKYANGAYGGITPKGEVAIHFYFERSPLPIDVEHDVDPDGKLSSKAVHTNPADLESTLVRVVENGVILSKDAAREIAKWLNDKADMLEGIEGSTKDGKLT